MGIVTLEAWVRPDDDRDLPLFEWSPDGSYGAQVLLNDPTPGCLYANLFDTLGIHHIIGTGPGVLF